MQMLLEMHRCGHDQLRVASLQPDWSSLRVGAASISAAPLMLICLSGGFFLFVLGFFFTCSARLFLLKFSKNLTQPEGDA